MKAIKTKEERKQWGCFYSPTALAHYVASKICEYIPSNKPITVLDPAVGDGELLIAVNNVRKNPKDFFIGIDIDESALQETFNRFNKEKIASHTFCCDALHPILSDNQTGWEALKNKCNLKDIDCIITNPPWGADILLSTESLSKFTTAVGQYDIYDLFIEQTIDLLSDGGIYGLIIPDSIYRREHRQIRKILLERTSIKFIARLGEFFFENVNTSVSIIIGVKGYKIDNIIDCIHLTNNLGKSIVSNKISFIEIENRLINKCNQDRFINDNYNITIDIREKDEEIISHLDSLLTIQPYLKSTRGVEISKKGDIIQCPSCKKWQPMPFSKEILLCCHCGCSFHLNNAIKDTLIINEPTDAIISPFLRGEDMERYVYHQRTFIKLGMEGINYKDLSIYKSPKILVRKTGVGITALLDYNENIVNQVVYVLKPSPYNDKRLSLEFYIALLNSRIITYYIIKKFGSSNWCTHPYLSQEMIGKLPIPDFRIFTKEDWDYVVEIEDIVKKLYSINNTLLSSEEEYFIECRLLKLFRLDIAYFKHIMQTIESVEQLIPFKRLLNIPKEKWDIDI